jgi:hypothetical protein
MGVTGLERPSVTGCQDSTLSDSGVGGGAFSGALRAQTDRIAPDLRRVIEAWPTVPEAVKASILAFVRASTGEGDEQR